MRMAELEALEEKELTLLEAVAVVTLLQELVEEAPEAVVEITLMVVEVSLVVLEKIIIQQMVLTVLVDKILTV